MTPLPVLNCDNCGACCEEMGAFPAGWYFGRFAFADGSLLPTAIQFDLLETLKRFDRDGWPPDGSPCIWYNAATRRCRNYEHRPELCKDFEVGGEGCLSWREKKVVA